MALDPSITKKIPIIPTDNIESTQRANTALKSNEEPNARLTLFITPNNNEKDNASKE